MAVINYTIYEQKGIYTCNPHRREDQNYTFTKRKQNKAQAQ